MGKADIQEEEELEKLFYRYRELLLSTERAGIDNLIKFLIESDFTEKPASTQYHLSERGGLLKHSLNVYNAFKKFNEMFNLRFGEDTMILTSLLHDICKIDVYHESKGRKPYYFKDPHPLGHGEKSLAILLKLKVELTQKEELMIRWHMGLNDDALNDFMKRVLRKDHEEIFIFYLIDYFTSQFLE